MYLLVGLGNPGKDYNKNRHNAGFMAIDAISSYHDMSADSKKFNGLFGSGSVNRSKIFYLKPTTYMNLSGNAVGECVRYYKINPENVIVFHDELDLVFGKVKLKFAGGAAGHNGIKSIIDHIGENFHRVRIGIGKPQNTSAKSNVKNFVLGDFSKADGDKLDEILAIIAKHSHLLLDDNKQHFVNKFHLELNKNMKKNPEKKLEKNPKNAGKTPSEVFSTKTDFLQTNNVNSDKSNSSSSQHTQQNSDNGSNIFKDKLLGFFKDKFKDS